MLERGEIMKCAYCQKEIKFWQAKVKMELPTSEVDGWVVHEKKCAVYCLKLAVVKEIEKVKAKQKELDRIIMNFGEVHHMRVGKVK